jgi:hypothetical protein
MEQPIINLSSHDSHSKVDMSEHPEPDPELQPDPEPPIDKPDPTDPVKVAGLRSNP